MDSTRCPILTIAYHLIENTVDYPSLIRLSMTCKLFKDLVDGRPHLSDRLFDQLEQGVFPSHIPSCKGRPSCWCNSLRRSFGNFPPNDKCSPLALCCPNFQSSRWLPYYGCHRILETGAFDREQSQLCHDLHSCQAYSRRCKICFDEAWETGELKFGLPCHVCRRTAF